MTTRQGRLAGITVGIGCAAIAGGIAMTAQAMATDGEISGGAQVGIVSVAGDGSDAFQCTFDDIDLADLLPESASVSAEATVGTVVGGSGEIVVGSGEIVAAAPGAGALPALEDAGGVMVDQLEVREGTVQECAALSDDGFQAAATSGAIAVTGQAELPTEP